MRSRHPLDPAMTAADVLLRFPEETCDGHVADTNRRLPPGLIPATQRVTAVFVKKNRASRKNI